MTDTDTLFEALEPILQAIAASGKVEEMDRHNILATLSKPEPAAVGEAVALIGKDWQLLWASPDSLKAIVERTGIEIGTKLYASPVPAPRAKGVSPSWEAIRNLPYDTSDDFIEVRRNERERIITALSSPSSEAISPPDARAVVLDQPFANTPPIDWSDYEWSQLIAALQSTGASK